MYYKNVGILIALMKIFANKANKDSEDTFIAKNPKLENGPFSNKISKICVVFKQNASKIVFRKRLNISERFLLVIELTLVLIHIEVCLFEGFLNILIVIA